MSPESKKIAPESQNVVPEVFKLAFEKRGLLKDPGIIKVVKETDRHFLDEATLEDVHISGYSLDVPSISHIADIRIPTDSLPTFDDVKQAVGKKFAEDPDIIKDPGIKETVIEAAADVHEKNCKRVFDDETAAQRRQLFKESLATEGRKEIVHRLKQLLAPSSLEVTKPTFQSNSNGEGKGVLGVLFDKSLHSPKG